MTTETKIETFADFGFTLTGRFIPFSQSRNSTEKYPSLNWKLALHRNGREVLSDFDYMQGCAWAPAYEAKVPCGSALRDRIVREQCENGKMHHANPNNALGILFTSKSLPLPDIKDVLASLFMDASAIDCGGFKEWCSDLGYSDDSISAKATFDACVEIGLKLRSCLGSVLFERGREMASDY